MLDDHRRKAISRVADLGHDKGLRPQITADKPNNVTMPVERFKGGGVIFAAFTPFGKDRPLVGEPAARRPGRLRRLLGAGARFQSE